MSSGAALCSVFAVAAAIAIAACYNAVLRLSPVDPLPLILPPLPPAVGPFAFNTLLSSHLRRIGAGLLPHPEDVAVDSAGFLFVGCADGWIKRVDPSSSAVENWTHLGDGHRPLGLALGLHGELIVCDADMGLLNVTRGNFEILSEEAQGVKFMLTDAAVVSREDGSIYFTDASSKYPYSKAMIDLWESRPNGRLLKYNPHTRTTSVILEELYFANGVALSADEDFLVFCETPVARCRRYWIKGEKAGHTESWIENLPSLPDNIKSDGNGRFWIGLVRARSSYMDFVLRHPFVMQLQFVLGVNNYFFHKLRYKGLVLATTEEGVPLFTLADPTGAAIRTVTSAVVAGDDLYLGSLVTDFVGHIKLNSTLRQALGL